MLVLVLSNSNCIIIFLMFLSVGSKACSSTFLVTVARRVYMILVVRV